MLKRACSMFMAAEGGVARWSAILFREAGVEEVLSDSIEIPTRFATFAEFWKPFLGGTGPAPSYVAALDSPHREALATQLERSLPREPDGAISLIARAWVVRGVAH